MKATYKLRKARKLKSFDLKLGSGTKAMKASVKRLARRGRTARSGARVGTLQIHATRGRRYTAQIRARRGRLYLRPVVKTLRMYKSKIRRYKGKKREKARKRLASYRRLVKKLRLKLTSKGKRLRLSGLPSKTKIKRLYINMNGKRGRTLRTPNKKSVTFAATARPKKGEAVTAYSEVELKKKKKKKSVR